MHGTLVLTEVKRHIRAAENVYVSTISPDGYPVTRVMFNLHNTERFPKQAAFLDGLDEDFRIYLATNTSSAKISQLQQTPRVSVYYHEPGSWQGMLVAGEAQVVTDMAVKRGLWQDEWAMYYQGGVESQDFAVVQLRPVFAEHYHDLTKETLMFTDG